MSQLNQSVVVTASDIIRIKQYIGQKYASQTPVKRAAIFSDAIHRIVDKTLVGVDPAYWQELKKGLFKRTLVANKDSINKQHIFDEIVTLQVETSTLCQMAFQWLTVNVPEEIDLRQLTQYVRSVKGPEPQSPVEWIEKAVELDERVEPDETMPVDYLNRYLDRVEPDDDVYALILESETFKPFRGIDPEVWRSLKNAFRKGCLTALEVLILFASLLHGALRRCVQTLAHRPFKLTFLGRVSLMMILVSGSAVFALQWGTRVESAVFSEDLKREHPLLLSSKKSGELTSEVLSRPIDSAKQSEVSSIEMTPAVSTSKKSVPTTTSKPKTVSRGHGLTGKIPSYFAYQKFNENHLKAMLVQRHSILAEAKYFKVVLETARRYNLDPRLLFAIAGQEQSLVSKKSRSATKIANNPYNVFGSWQKYNTSLSDSSEIVCKTIVNRMAKWHGEGSPLDWLNRTYADDPDWADGVKHYYEWFKKGTQ